MTRTLNAAPLVLTRTRAIEWLYADRIPLRTGTILAGQGGIAKSTIISDVVAKATRGDLPGTFYGTPVVVGMISPEDDVESVLVPRLMAAGANLENVVNVSVTVTDDNRSWTTLPNIGDDLAALGDLIRDNGIRLLVVDPLVSIMTGNSISQSDVRRNFDPLSALARDYDFALLAVAHFGKSGERAGDRLSGSHAFRDIARVLIVAAVDEETGQRVVTVEKSNYSAAMPSDAYAIESQTVPLHDGNTQSVGRAVLLGQTSLTVQDLIDRDRDATTRLSGDSQQVIAAVANYPEGVGAEQVATDLGWDVERARTYLNRAAGRGDITRVRRGVFEPNSTPNPSRKTVSSVSSVLNSEHSIQTTHISMSTECVECRTPLHADLISAGITVHPGCEVAA